MIELKTRKFENLKLTSVTLSEGRLHQASNLILFEMMKDL